MITLGLALVAAIVAAYEGGSIGFDWRNFHWKPAVVSSSVFFLLFAAYHYFRAQWEIEKEGQSEYGELKVALASAISEVHQYKPRIRFLGGGPTAQAQLGILHASMVQNANAHYYNHAHGVHGMLKFEHATQNAITVEIGWKGESTVEPPTSTVSILGGFSRQFVWLMQIENHLYIPEVKEGLFHRRHPEMGDGIYKITAELAGSNCDPVTLTATIQVDHGALQFLTGWSQVADSVQ